jgi:hypothetical protein
MTVGHTAYLELSDRDQVTEEINFRLNNNLPRFRKQSQELVRNGHCQCSAQGLTIDYVLKVNRLKSEIFESGIDESSKSFSTTVPPIGKWRIRALQREMARIEVEVWP